MSCTASINPLSALHLQAPCLSQPTSAHIFAVPPQSGRSVFTSKASHSLCCPSEGLDPHAVHPGLGQREAQRFHLRFLQLRPLSFPLNHATPPSTATALYTVVFTPADALYCTLHPTLLSIGCTRLLQLFLHSPLPFLKKKKKKGGGSLNIDEF